MNTNSFKVFILLMTFLILTKSSLARAQGWPFKNEYLEQTPIFKKNYLMLGSAKNIPIWDTRDTFNPGHQSLILGFSHFTANNWQAAITTQFKTLYPNYRSGKLALFSITQVTKKIIRLYHPVYFGFGTKIHYLSPSKTSKFPLNPDDDYSLEFGIAATADLKYVLSNQSFLSNYMDIWKSTKKSTFYALEFGVTFSYPVWNN